MVLADTGMTSPVIGFLPGRVFFFFNLKVPKPDILTSSPFSKSSKFKHLKATLLTLKPAHLSQIVITIVLKTRDNMIQ